MNKYFILINPTNPLLDESIFKKVNCNSKYDSKCTAEENALEAFKKLQQFILDNGYTIDIESAYRSKDEQQIVWDDVLEKEGLDYTQKFVAVPGYSEHQSGLAIDFTLYENGRWYVDHQMGEHEVLDLVKQNAYKFGFIIRYPKGKEKITGYHFEPWHLRYIGDIAVAKYILDNNLCLEEYLESE